MNKFTVTLKQLRKAGACYEGYNKLVRGLQGKPFTAEDMERKTYIRFKHDTPINLAFIARNNDIGDALWATRCLEGCDRDLRLFAVWCARRTQHRMTDPRSIAAIDVAERFANGEATADELCAAEGEALNAWFDAFSGLDSARAAACTVTIDASDAIWNAASWAVFSKECAAAQRQRFIEMYEKGEF